MGFLRGLRRFVVGFLIFNMLLRVLKNFIDIPMPEFMAGLIDNPIRRRYLMPPEATAARHGVRPGLRVLEIGPGSGTYTAAAARLVGPQGQVTAVDIQPRMIARVERKMALEGITNVDARVANVYSLPYPEGHFDAAYMIFVLGEIPEPPRALGEIFRVLRPGGTLAVSEFAVDPDYSRDVTVLRLARAAGFRLFKKQGNALYYTLTLEK